MPGPWPASLALANSANPLPFPFISNNIYFTFYPFLSFCLSPPPSLSLPPSPSPLSLSLSLSLYYICVSQSLYPSLYLFLLSAGAPAAPYIICFIQLFSPLLFCQELASTS